MTTHSTKSGYVELIGSWGHGKAPSKDFAAMPATLISDDGDGHFTAWCVVGGMRDAASVIGAFDVDRFGGVAIFSGNTVTREDAPAGFYRNVLDDDGELVELEPQPLAFPNVVAV